MDRLDQSFGVGSLLNLPLSTDTHGTHQVGTSVLVDSSGRIVIAGIRSNNGFRMEQIVLRLLSDGSFDETFGNAGLFIGPAIDVLSSFSDRDATSILQTATGGYRLTIDSDSCQILALTEGGTVDDTFGNAGLASVVNFHWRDDRLQQDGGAGRWSLGGGGVGIAHGQGFVTRLLANGESDPGFAADTVGHSCGCNRLGS